MPNMGPLPKYRWKHVFEELMIHEDTTPHINITMLVKDIRIYFESNDLTEI